MNYVAIIPARGGSKGIAGKNILSLAGKPMIQYSIEQALNALRVDDVYVTTDDDEIARISRQCHAHVITRPAEFATDIATSESALLHAIEQISAFSSRTPDAVVFLQCTSPLRTSKDIDGAIELFESKQADSLLSVVESYRFFWKERYGTLSASNYDAINRPRRQDMEPDLMETGSLYIFSTAGFKKSNNRLFGKIVGYRMLPETAFEVDERHDLILVEALLEDWKQRGLI